MCMDEFVKILYDFMGIYKIFWNQNSDYRYLLIFYRYFTDIYRYFTDIFSKIPAQARVLHSRDFSVEKSVFSDFSAKNRRFYRFSPIFPLIDFSSDFSSRCWPKTDFSTKYRPKKPIFCSLVATSISCRDNDFKFLQPSNWSFMLSRHYSMPLQVFVVRL